MTLKKWGHYTLAFGTGSSMSLTMPFLAFRSLFFVRKIYATPEDRHGRHHSAARHGAVRARLRLDLTAARPAAAGTGLSAFDPFGLTSGFDSTAKDGVDLWIPIRRVPPAVFLFFDSEIQTYSYPNGNRWISPLFALAFMLHMDPKRSRRLPLFDQSTGQPGRLSRSTAKHSTTQCWGRGFLAQCPCLADVLVLAARPSLIRMPEDSTGRAFVFTARSAEGTSHVIKPIREMGTATKWVYLGKREPSGCHHFLNLCHH